MKIKHIAILAIGFFCFIPHSSIQASNSSFICSENQIGGNTIHIVEKGETIYSIATKYNATVKEMYDLNPSSATGIKVGQELLLPQTQNSQNIQYHTIEKKETLYSVSREYNITTDELLAANMGLSADNFRVGNRIIIPSKKSNIESTKQNYIEHEVKAKETLYGISKQYTTSIQSIIAANPSLNNGLVIGMVLKIPSKTNELATTSSNINILPSENSSTLSQFSSKDTKKIKIGVFLPFLNKSDALQARLIEYYEGFLLAIEKMKAKGVSIDVYTFDIASDAKLKALLESNDIQDLNIIIGGKSESQMDILAAFTQKYGIQYVLPFPSKKTSMNDNMYVVNIPQTLLETKAGLLFCNKYKNDNIIILSNKDKSRDNKSDFVNNLTKKLKQNGNTPKNISITLNLVSEMTQSLSATNDNVIVPSSSSLETLSNLIVVLKSIQEKNPDFKIQLFGYPDWQAYKELVPDMKTYNTTIYTSFFTEDNKDMNVFSSNFRSWYGKSMLETYPKYALYGYDTGIYFSSAISKYGNNFSKNASKFKLLGLQTAFDFEHANEGGYINNGFYLVNYTSSGIEKITYNK